MTIHRDVGLETLLELDGSVLEQEDGFWIKVEVKVVEASEHIPHGIRYSLTLHDRYGTRVLGYDNAHACSEAAEKVQICGMSLALRAPAPHLQR